MLVVLLLTCLTFRLIYLISSTCVQARIARPKNLNFLFLIYFGWDVVEAMMLYLLLFYFSIVK
jgi:hypothetical protein